MKKDIDVFGIGTVAVDYIATVSHWPVCGTKQPLLDFQMYDGGNTAAALVAAARLGARTYFSAALNNNDVSTRARQTLASEGVDTSQIVYDATAEPITAVVISSLQNHQRTILFSPSKFRCAYVNDFPDPNILKLIKILLIDHNSGAAGIGAANTVKRYGGQVIVDLERDTPCVNAALEIADHIVVSANFACQHTHKNTLDEAAYAIRHHADQTVIFTRGENGCIGLHQQHMFQIAGHKIAVIDTTGCGDVFHGAYAWANC
ncbi:hypothetical protein JW960_00115 [candidate division KSB1 bacterium]|nr:hypothetical protein [candidate division KSB1 bacterium]